MGLPLFLISLATDVNVASTGRYITSKINVTPHNSIIIIIFQRLIIQNNVDLDKTEQNVASFMIPIALFKKCQS